MKKNALPWLSVGLIALMGIAGCFGGKGGDAGPAVPVATLVNMAGALTVPATINSDLLAKVEVPYTDSVVQRNWASASVLVNGAAVSGVSITPTTITPKWDFRLSQVVQPANGLYKVEVNVGKVGLKATVTESSREAFTIDSRTTAATLLSAELLKIGISKDPQVLLATFPVFVSDIAKEIENAFRTAEVGSVATNIFSLSSLTREVSSQAVILKDVASLTSSALVANLQLQNDLDGDGTIDLQIVRNTDSTAVRFYTAMSASTSMRDQVAGIGDYTDAALLSDFARDNTSQKRFFSADSQNFALGFFFKKSAAADVYLKLFIRKIDLVDGSFRGVTAEYQYVTATSTALASGTKTFTLASQTPAVGTVAGSDFLNDGQATATTLCFIDAAKGLGSLDGSQRLVRLLDGKPSLGDVTAAEPYLQGGVNYYPNTSAALEAVYKTRTIEVGDVFSAYFPATRNYVLFKIIEITTNTVNVDFKVNGVPGENRF